MNAEKMDAASLMNVVLQLLQKPETEDSIGIPNPLDKDLNSSIRKIKSSLQAKYYKKTIVEKFIDKANNLLLNYAQHRYSKELKLTNDDVFDSLVTSLNFLGQELNNSTVTTHYLHDVFNSIGDIVLVINRVGTMLYVNSSACEMLGYQEYDLRDMNVEMILGKGKNLQHLLHSQINQMPVIFKTADGDSMPVSLKISNFERSDNPMMGYVVIARDLSVIFKHQQEIQKKNRIIVKANKDLEKALKSLETILDSIDAFIYIADVQSQELLFINQYGQNLWPVKPEELTWTFINESMGDSCPYNDGNISGNYKVYPDSIIHWEFQCLANSKWYDCRDKGITWADGRKVRLVIAADISERKKAEKELMLAKEKAEESDYMHRFLMENMTDGVIYFDADGFVIYANKSASRILGTTTNGMMGMSAFDQHFTATAEDGRSLALDEYPFVVTLRSGKAVKGFIMCIYEPENINCKWLRINSVPRFSGISDEINLVVVTLEDVTHIRNAENERILKENLEKKVMLAEESLKFKQKFLANMSHEIRTPLTGIMGITEALSKTELSERQTEFLKILQVSGESLRGIIDDVLDYSKIEAGKIKLNKNVFSPAEALKSARDLFSNIAQHGIELKMNISDEMPDYIEADELRISQVVRNFLSNAVKFTEKGCITLSAGLDKKSVDETTNDILIRISVTDTGIGIAEEKLNELFMPFVQLDNNSQKRFDGTGLGLSICKEIAGLHGGEIGVESKIGLGSKFWFTFQAKSVRGNNISPNEKVKSTGNIQNMNILLVEDNIINQKVFSINLKYLGHNVTLADNGLQALELIKNNAFDIILMDVQMPVMDGVTATQKLRELYKELPPIVGLSANAFEGDREKYMESGMDEYLTKPLRLEDFSAIVSKLFNHPANS